MRTIRDEDRERSTDGTHAIDGVKCTRATDKAILVLVEGEEFWVPQSQVHDDSEVYKAGDEGKLVVSGWYARQKGWA